MEVLCCLWVLGLIAPLGYAAIAVVLGPQRMHPAELAGLSFAAGFGWLGWILLLCSMAGWVPNRTILICCTLAACVCIAVMRRQRPRVQLPAKSGWSFQSVLAAMAIFLIVGASINVALPSLSPSVADFDMFGTWMFKAKILAVQPLRPIPPALLDPTLSYSHQDYPLGMPLVVAGTYAAVGGVDEQLGKAFLLPLFLALTAVMYGTLRRFLNRGWSASVTAVFVTAPILVQHAGMGVAELPLVAMHTCCILLLWRWMAEKNRRDLLACAIFGAWAAMQKNEGIALLPLVALFAMGFALIRVWIHHGGTESTEKKFNLLSSPSPGTPPEGWGEGSSREIKQQPKPIRDWAYSATLAALLVLPWMIYSRHLPRTHEDYGNKLTNWATITAGAARLKEILPMYAQQFWQFNNAGPIWLILVVTAIVGWRAFGSLPVLLLWMLAVVHWLLYLATFMVTPWDVKILAPMVSPKLLMHISPVAALLIGLHLRSMLAHPPTSQITDDAL